MNFHCIWKIGNAESDRGSMQGGNQSSGEVGKIRNCLYASRAIYAKISDVLSIGLKSFKSFKKLTVKLYRSFMCEE